MTSAPDNADRITPVLAAVESAWRLTPDLRIGQLIYVLAKLTNWDVFYIPDSELHKAILYFIAHSELEHSVRSAEVQRPQKANRDD